jgi:ParB/RepB/Spo0J family partition protein
MEKRVMATVSIDKIVVTKNVRTFDGQELSDDFSKLPDDVQGGIKELAESIKSQGQIQPIVVKNQAKGKYTLVAGWRRFMAHKYLERAQIVATVTKSKVEDEPIIQLIENIHREDLEPMDIARGLRDVMAAKDCKQKDLAKLCSKSTSWVSQHLNLLELDPEVQEAVEDGELNIGGARALATLPKPEQKKALEAAREESKEETKQAEKGKKKPGAKKKTSVKKSKSGKSKIKDKGSRRQARKSPGKKKPVKIRPVAERFAEQKEELIAEFIDVEFGQTAATKPQLEVVDKLLEFLHERQRLVIN